MSKVFVTSDWHLGHKNILKYRPEFTSIKEHNDTIINNYLDIVTKRDVVYFLGDIAFSKEGLELVKELPGDKRLILGNHDTEHLHITDFIDIFTHIHSIYNNTFCFIVFSQILN